MSYLEQCRGCHSGSDAWREVLRMDPMPLAGRFCRSAEEARVEPIYPLTWIECGRCGLVQVLEDLDDALLYGQYNYGSSTVAGLVQHFEAYAAFLAARFGGGPVRLLEVGCNDGVLLSRLPRAWRLVGVDPSDVARLHRTDGYDLINLPFSDDLAGRIPGAGEFDVVTSSNSLAHISDLLDVFRGIHTVLRPGGEFIVEVHDLDATLRDGQWDTVYHEHKVEWSEDSLANCVLPLGFELLSVDRLPLHGGLLRVGFRKTVGHPIDRPMLRARPSFDQFVEAYLGRRQTPVYRTIRAQLNDGATLSAYGAAGRANVYLNQLPELRVEYIVDDSPIRMSHWRGQFSEMRTEERRMASA